MTIGRKLIFWPPFAVTALAPYLVVQLLHPSTRTIESEGSTQVGTVVTASGNSVDIFVMMGDVFAPKRTRRDIGFDLVGVSCYFDPIEIHNRQVLVTNPLLNSALAYSARDSAEFTYFVDHLFEALEESRQVVACFLTADEGTKPCEGDQLTPFVWTAYDRSAMFHDQGVKYLAALPMFDPSLFLNQASEEDLRKRLGINVETVVKRLVGYSMENLQTTVHSIGLAALGSTSHRGGDSPAFLNFQEGFLRSLQGVITSKTPSNVDRVYFVGFIRHTGVYREETLEGLQAISDYLILMRLGSASGATLATALYSLLWLSISVLLYQNIGYILKQQNRWNLLGTLLAPNALIVGLTWGTVVALISSIHPKGYYIIYWANAGLTMLGVGLLTYVSKRFTVSKSSIRTRVRQTTYSTPKTDAPRPGE